MNIFELFKKNILSHEPYEALAWHDKRYNSREILKLWHDFSAVMTNLSVTAGDKIAILLPNVPEIHIAFPAIWKLGAVIAPIHYTYSTNEVSEILDTILPNAIITTHERAQELNRILPSSFERKRILVTNYAPKSTFSDFYGSTVKDPPQNIPVYQASENDPAIIVFSSGSSGKPKGIIQTQGGLISLVEGCKGTTHASTSVFRPFHEPKLSISIDFSSYAHTGRIFFLVMAYSRKQKTIILDKFEPLAILKSIQDEGVTVFAAPPTAYEMICSHPLFPNYNISTVKTWISLAAPLSEEKLQQFEALLNNRIYSIYGLSESIAIVTCEPGNATHRPGSVGLPISGTEIKIIRENGDTCPPGEMGELCIKRKANAIGYLNLPEESAKMFRPPWIHTGDMAQLDAEGYLYIMSRKSSMINLGGFKVIPSEVEAAINKIPSVERSVVAGIPDELFGQAVGAFILLKPNSTLDEFEVQEHCSTLLSAYKVPTRVVFVSEFPMTKTMKVDTQKLIKENIE